MPVSHELQIETTHGAILAGTLTLPDAAGIWPALIAVHGASEGTRDNPLQQHLASLLPPHGMATLLFDRRGEGASTGSPDVGFEDLAPRYQFGSLLAPGMNVTPASAQTASEARSGQRTSWLAYS